MNSGRIFSEPLRGSVNILPLDVKADSYGNLLIPILLKKLPEELTRLIFRANPSADKSLTELRTELRKEIETRERSHTAATSERALSEDEVLVPTTGTFLTTTDQGACKVNYQTTEKNTYIATVHTDLKNAAN